MCRSCSTLVQRNFSCGHQLLLRKGNTTFCLFYPHKTDEYHTVYTQYETKPRDYECKECQIRKNATTKGLRGAERHEYIKTAYAKTTEAKSRQEAKNEIIVANESRKVVDPEKIVELNKKACEQVQFYLGRRGHHQLDMYSRGILLKTVLEAPDAIDRKALVRLFGSYAVFNQKDKVRNGLPAREKGYILAIARRAGLSRTLEEGLAMRKPEGFDEGKEIVVEKTVVEKAAEEKITEEKTSASA